MASTRIDESETHMTTQENRRVSRRQFIGAGGAAAIAFTLHPRGAARATAGGAGFAFGLVADPQYCDCPDRRTRHYRASLGKLAEAARTFNAEDLSFTAQVGDIIDRHEASFDDILPVFERVRGPKHHVLGNHDFPIPAEEVVARLGMPAATTSSAGRAGGSSCSTPATSASTPTRRARRSTIWPRRSWPTSSAAAR